MQRYSTKAIILRRVNYSEADRVITFLTPTHGKIAVIAKGVRRVKSRLAGGIELFSESEVTIVEGKGSLDILASARLKKYYKNIVSDYSRVTAGYQVIKYVNQLAEDDAGSEFYDLLLDSFEALDELKISIGLVEAWYKLNILKLMGSEPDLTSDNAKHKLVEGETYSFDFREGTFSPDKKGNIKSTHIKTWRLLLANQPAKVSKVKGASEAVDESLEVLNKLYNHQLN